MANKYVARLKNARRIGHRLKRLQKEGCIIIDDEGHNVSSEKISFKGFGNDVGLRVGCVVYFTSDTEWDNGMHTPIPEFNERFKKWRAVHPRSFEPITT